MREGRLALGRGLEREKRMAPVQGGAGRHEDRPVLQGARRSEDWQRGRRESRHMEGDGGQVEDESG